MKLLNKKIELLTKKSEEKLYESQVKNNTEQILAKS